ARELLQRYCGGPGAGGMAPPVLLDWLRRHAADAAQRQIEPPPLRLAQGARALSFRLHRQTGDGDGEAEGGGDWLIVMREESDAAVIEALGLSLALTAREAEVLYWLVKGKTNRDIGEILGASPATIKKHLERVYVKLGVETRTAAATAALRRVRQLQPQFQG
ncbi:MAG TPA: helix-turn-helix transcriptional regulator, partial [Pseudorhodoferax sp.]|nr:helix-turn-helix transcriptional regulator [Pseudorhodoferax sp.]